MTFLQDLVSELSGTVLVQLELHVTVKSVFTWTTCSSEAEAELEAELVHLKGP